MTYRRWLLPVAFLASLGAGSWAFMDARNADRAERLQDEAFARRRGDVLIRQGISLYQRAEYSAAESS